MRTVILCTQTYADIFEAAYALMDVDSHSSIHVACLVHSYRCKSKMTQVPNTNSNILPGVIYDPITSQVFSHPPMIDGNNHHNKWRAFLGGGGGVGSISHHRHYTATNILVLAKDRSIPDKRVGTIRKSNRTESDRTKRNLTEPHDLEPCRSR